MSAQIAGHHFDSRDRCTCGIRWLDIMDADAACLGKEGFAHVGSLNDYELVSIKKERERRQKVFEAAMCAITGRQVEEVTVVHVDDTSGDYMLGCIIHPDCVHAAGGRSDFMELVAHGR
jgi:hypothetical protein